MCRTMRALLVIISCVITVSAAGCAAEVDRSEVEQKANPVTSMHQEVRDRLTADENRVEWFSYEDAIVKARKENKFVMVDFYASWCTWCKKFEADTMTDPGVSMKMKDGFVAVKLDAESSTKVVHEMRQMSAFELADEYGVKSYPAIWFLNPDGTRAKQLNGYLDAGEFRDYLEYIRSGAYKEREF